MLREAILVDREDTCQIKRKVICFMELQCKPSTKELAHFVLVQPEVDICQGNTLRCSVDIHTLHRTVTLHDTLASSVVSVTACLAIIREYHQAVVLIPTHLSGSIRRIIRYQHWITVGIVCVMVVTNLCWSRRMVTVLILISEVIRLSSCRNYQQVAPSNSRILVIGI